MKTLNPRTTFQAKIANTFADPAAIQSSLEAVLVPEQISKWLGRLRLLKGVPFNYLVPDERMLPPESIRFFYLDINWIDSLLDGAFSIGRNLTKTENAFSHNLDSAVTPVGTQMPFAQHTRVAKHRIQRRAQLVRQHGEKLVLDAVGLFGLAREPALCGDVARNLRSADDGAGAGLDGRD